MEQLKKELDESFDKFQVAWPDKIDHTIKAMCSNDDIFRTNYKNLSSFQGWRSFLENKISKESLSFFFEAQNDAIMSHVLAGMGIWRSSLKSLRSCIENIFFASYYKDHPIELQLWNEGIHKLSFSESIKYFEVHPAFRKCKLNALQNIRYEYSTLSRAVHGSSITFRMTNDSDSINFCKADVIKLKQWYSRTYQTVSSLNIFLLVLFANDFKGNYNQELRKCISLAINKSALTSIKSNLNIRLYK